MRTIVQCEQDSDKTERERESMQVYHAGVVCLMARWSGLRSGARPDWSEKKGVGR